METLKGVEGIIFDMDGLMLDTERISLRAWQRAAELTGLHMPAEVPYLVIGRGAKDTPEILRRALGEAFPLGRFLETAGRVYHEMIEARPPPLKPGLLELLDFLDSREVPKVVATSTRARTGSIKLKSVNLYDRFSGHLFGDQVDRGKPNPEIFLKAAVLLGLSPSSCLVLEDSLSGIEGACKARIPVIMVPDLIEPTDEIRKRVTAVCGSLRDVAALLRKAWSTSVTTSNDF